MTRQVKFWFIVGWLAPVAMAINLIYVYVRNVSALGMIVPAWALGFTLAFAISNTISLLLTALDEDGR